MITISNLHKEFHTGSIITKVLKGIDLTIEEGSFVAIYGPSGSGKSTFIYQCAFLDTPTSGEIDIHGTKSSQLNEEQKTRFRLENFGFVFQDYAILPELSSVENVMLPLLMRGIPLAEARKQSIEMLDSMGLGDKHANLPKQLSGGQQQRVSIARAMAGNPKILFADEPTANLDSESSASVIESIEQLHKKGQTIILVTHEEEYTRIADRILTLKDGVIINDEKRT